MPVFALSIHAPYVCRDAGACCTAGWAIPIDALRERRLAGAIQLGTVRFPARASIPSWRVTPSGPPPGEAVLSVDPDGACVFFDHAAGRHCAIHAQLGHDWLPIACQQFPRVTLADDRGLHVTLSHYCPTAASLLFDHPNETVEIVEDPPGLAKCPLAPGLDARGHWPPLLRPGILCTAVTWTAWERFLVGVLGSGTLDPFEAVATVIHAARRLAEWPAGGPALDDHAMTVLGTREGPPGVPALDADAEHAAARHAVPPERARAWLPRDSHAAESGASLDAAAHLLVRRRVPVGRYLAARAFANWCAYQAHGVRAAASAVRTSMGVLQMETARLLATEGGPRDDGLLLEAIRRADWLLVHLAEGDALARHWNRAETGRAGH